MEDDWMTIDQAAEFLGVARRTLFNYAKQGKLRAFKAAVGGRTMFRRQDLEAFKTPQPREARPEEKAV